MECTNCVLVNNNNLILSASKLVMVSSKANTSPPFLVYYFKNTSMASTKIINVKPFVTKIRDNLC